MEQLTADDSHHGLLTAADDGLHDLDGGRWAHETSWWWFHVAERGLGGWLYNWSRPAIGTSGGGCWVWDPSTFLHWEVPYYACYANLAAPTDATPQHITYPSRAEQHTLDPLTRYRLGYRDRDRIVVDLVFDAVMAPWVATADGDPPAPHHLDQVGRLTGELTLHGEAIPVDCLAIRDRTWAVRHERWTEGRVGYANAAAPDGTAFLAQSAAGIRGETGERVYSGYLQRAGERRRLVDGTRTLHRHRDHGYLERIEVRAVDTTGRALSATGTSVSRMAMPIPGVHGVVWTSLVRWEIDGVEAWGEDQDAWPIHAWSDRRAGRLEP